MARRLLPRSGAPKGAWLLLAVPLLLLAALAPMLGSGDLNGAPTTNVENANCVCHTLPTPGSELAVSLAIAGPERIAANSSANVYAVTLDVAGLPSSIDAEHLSWGFSADLDGEHLTGARLSADVPSETYEAGSQLASSDYLRDDHFNVTLRGPSAAGSLTLTVVGMYTNADRGAEGDPWATATMRIEVVPQRFVNLTVQVDNTGGAEASGIVADFSIDGLHVGNDTLERLDVGTSENLTFQWDASFVLPGDYLVEVDVHAGEGQVELDDGNNHRSQVIHVGAITKPPKATGGDEVTPLLSSKIFLFIYVIVGMAVTVALLGRWLR